jgi:hypothetical protein
MCATVDKDYADKNNGKLKTVAIVAVVRKLLVIINNCCKQYYPEILDI